MADNALLTGCLLLCLVPVMARLSPVDLLGPPRRTQILMGVMGGVASALVIVMLGWKVPELDIAVYPTITAFIGLYFGAPAALICAALALVPLLWTSDAGWFAGCVALGVAIVLSAIWRSMDTLRVANPWFNMLGLAVTVPLGIELCFLATGLIEPATGSSQWWVLAPWPHTLGIVVLGIARLLLGSKAQSALSLDAARSALDDQALKLRLAFDSLGGGRRAFQRSHRSGAWASASLRPKAS